ncbi:ABC transporter substrate-binding protein LplA [Gracilibacillus halophilus YIM-C55.5]|uniref:ABC transporter substrate-binding protein LplA n=1 Tax=Gracilibacillus halophilus YIM-C55.5 TaxID=1308866 RepID=N4WCA6_9BACI|nr:extracellular solute-binding protein [Gracilibacillus halophilus]ENH97913.1 ABC transporter substrate-binding protein LplA [Gracilibacillus halophilus YIM-C55.5]
MMKRKKKLWLILFSCLLMVILIGCNSDDEASNQEDTDGTNNDESQGENNQTDEEPFDISIMTTSFSPEPPEEDSPAWEAIEEFTNTNLDITFVPNSNYDERFNITLASGELPSIILTGKTPSFISAVEDGAFWDLTDYVDEYENLSQMNEIVKNNISIKGRIYSLYRSRPLGRKAVTIRKDWLDNLGMEMPQTIDEFYDVMYAFTHDDPDGNGKDDTIGTVISEYEGPWDIMQTWFGVPNKWGIDDEGKLYPHFQDPQYREALDFFKKMYDEGLVNEDFAVMDPAKWHDEFVNGRAGTVIDVADAASRNQDNMVKEDSSLEGSVDLFGAVEGPEGLTHLPTTGYSMMFAISKTAVQSEEELHKVLEFMDQMSTEEGQNLAFNGVEGRHYEIVDGEYTPSDDQALIYEHEDLNQLLTFIPEERHLTEPLQEIEKKEEQVMKNNEEIVVENPAEPLVSEVYGRQGEQLDNIILDARVQYIVGQIDESGLDEAEELWMNSGGKEYIEEINQLYQEAQANQ